MCGWVGGAGGDTKHKKNDSRDREVWGNIPAKVLQYAFFVAPHAMMRNRPSSTDRCRACIVVQSVGPRVSDSWYTVDVVILAETTSG